MDKLNSLSYAFHYRSLDSVKYYCDVQKADSLEIIERSYPDGEAERYNNTAFYWISKMNYQAAEDCLNAIPQFTDNQIELLICYVQQMRLCQRRSQNKNFYDYQERAANCLRRINEERGLLDERQLDRLCYAETELAIVTSTYYYYIGLERQSSEALLAIEEDYVKRDTAQFLNYLYNIGAGGIIVDGSPQDIARREFDCLLRCYQVASQHDYPYFMANALEAMAEHLIREDYRQLLMDEYAPGLSMASFADVGSGHVSADTLMVSLAQRSLDLFRSFGDVYQTAGAYRTLSSCYRACGNDQLALENLHQALADSAIFQAPDLVASIYEQLSVAYAAVDDKPSSDYYRNLYLDLQEQTRQDRQLEARAEQLEHAVQQQNLILLAVLAVLVLLLVMLILLRRFGKRERQESPLTEQLDEQREKLAVSRLHLEESERRHLEQRAKMSLVNSLLPLIERAAHEAKRLTADAAQDSERMAYIRELTEQIESDNELLTRWIQLRQGQLNLRIESFPLQPLFDMVARGRKSFQMRGIELDVQPTNAVVKADRILTLFMLNTLSDNARKFTKSGGQVHISTTETDSYVEISVRDNGVGMDEQQLAHVFQHQINNHAESVRSDVQSSHGFGLLNCKGIIEKYRKLSQIFSVCTLQAESEVGKGSRFFFRLPKGVVRALVIAFLLGIQTVIPQTAGAAPHLSQAKVFADSAYFSNIQGNYTETLRYADSCRYWLNRHYQEIKPGGQVLMTDRDEQSATPAEIRWFRDSVPTNYHIILDIRNESAVAALALHDWEAYRYYNRIYTQLFRELSADVTLGDYCRTMQQTRTNQTIAVIMLVLLVLAVLTAYYVYSFRPRLTARFSVERSRMEELEKLHDELRKTNLELERLYVSNAVLDNCFSTLKHETMYFPSRIRQLMEQGDVEAVKEVIDYYRELYALLSMQAQYQLECVKLHLQKLDHGILGDATLVRYLIDILRRAVGQKTLNITYTPYGDKYMELSCVLTGGTCRLSVQDRLLCRQIARDHGEAANRLACCFMEEQLNENETKIIIRLPAYEKL